MGLALVDDAGAGLDVEVHPLAGEPLVAVVESDAAGGDGVAGRAVELDPVGEKARLRPE